MGKTQSKRSVDITTEGKKTAEDGITGKLEKIEDVDQRKQGNGEASQETNELEKKIDTEEPENDKDLTTEKCAESQENAENVENTIDAAKDTPPEGNVTEEISPLSDESAKKSKKEKVKKKWSFRSISFGKKDKQKPCKSEETTEEIVANGEAENSEATVEKHEALKDSGAAGDADTKIVASDKDINDEEKITPTKKSPDVDVGISAATCATVEKVSEPANITDLITEKQTDGNEIAPTVEAVEVIVSNVLNTEDKKIETVSTEKITATTNDKSASLELIKEVISKEINKNDGCDGEKPQENGTIEDQQTNALIEVNTDKASEEPIRLDPTVPNVNEENENITVDNHNNQNEMQNQVNLCDNRVKSIVQNDSLPPPLPCSPPPSHVSVFAFSNNTESDVSTSKVVLNSLESANAEFPPNTELNLLISVNEDIKTDNHNNTKETTDPVVISNELDKNGKTVLSHEVLLDSTSSLQKLNCIKLDSSAANLVDIDCTKETQDVKAVEEQLEKEEIIAATVVKEISETAVVLCQQQIKENYINKENNEDKDCVTDPSSTDSILTNDTNEALIEIYKELQIETNTLSEQEDCLLEKIVQLKLSDDELRNDSEISKDLSKTDNAPEVITQELTVSCE